mmetsp:Transcript_15039/g.24909  ORF Transcript_15039/g.24909 Transcript_15039/m.24909 type:complete len:94 (-) Transcript_15039:426-707(-)|eukprot:CAMPEP_0119023438 /NCGR_PEP_ID=MMETSP1176-20130426/29970_1 /TAXON_ID=265551 /ORGANISM="Synedropsis recta cf, Strain CCMP1620" /LENGTH=93 /DNA_ID=CAMNT_0006978521 /DNA_START=867 /DNA_END=1148 /DNA_ORIENTATION=-
MSSSNKAGKVSAGSTASAVVRQKEMLKDQIAAAKKVFESCELEPRTAAASKSILGQPSNNGMLELCCPNITPTSLAHQLPVRWIPRFSHRDLS